MPNKVKEASFLRLFLGKLLLNPEFSPDKVNGVMLQGDFDVSQSL